MAGPPVGPAMQAGGGSAPRRPACSIRRTASIDTHWPDGRDAPSRIVARSRDAVTGASGALRIVEHASVQANASLDRRIVAITSADARVSALAGLGAGKQLRARLRDMFVEPSDRDGGLYFLLDDLAGATLVASWGWFVWDGINEALIERVEQAEVGGRRGDMRGVCIGLARGSAALDERGRPRIGEQSSAVVLSLIDPNDPEGWHELPGLPGPATRRARWIDVTRTSTGVAIGTGFQDSAVRRDGRRQAVHEYRVAIAADGYGRIGEVVATPYVLPHPQCPAAVGKLDRLRGEALADLREIVPQLLAGEEGCTHLNDVLRSLSCVPALASQLPRIER